MLKFGKNEATICSGKKHILCLFQKLFLFKFGFVGENRLQKTSPARHPERSKTPQCGVLRSRTFASAKVFARANRISRKTNARLFVDPAPKGRHPMGWFDSANNSPDCLLRSGWRRRGCLQISYLPDKHEFKDEENSPKGEFSTIIFHFSSFIFH